MLIQLSVQYYLKVKHCISCTIVVNHLLRGHFLCYMFDVWPDLVSAMCDNCYSDELILRSVAAEAVIRSSWAAQPLNDLWALAGGGRSCSSRGGRTQGKALGARPIIIVLLPPCHLHQQHHHVCHFQLHRVSAGESGGRLRELVVEESGFFGGIFAGGSCLPVSAWTRSRWVRWQATTLCHLCFSCNNHH